METVLTSESEDDQVDPQSSDQVASSRSDDNDEDVSSKSDDDDSWGDFIVGNLPSVPTPGAIPDNYVTQGTIDMTNRNPLTPQDLTQKMEALREKVVPQGQDGKQKPAASLEELQERLEQLDPTAHSKTTEVAPKGKSNTDQVITPRTGNEKGKDDHTVKVSDVGSGTIVSHSDGPSPQARVNDVEYPTLEPPDGVTHCHGYWFRGSGTNIVWRSYLPPISFPQLPLNLKIWDNHWIGRVMPDGKALIGRISDGRWVIVGPEDTRHPQYRNQVHKIRWDPSTKPGVEQPTKVRTTMKPGAYTPGGIPTTMTPSPVQPDKTGALTHPSGIAHHKNNSPQVPMTVHSFNQAPIPQFHGDTTQGFVPQYPGNAPQGFVPQYPEGTTQGFVPQYPGSAPAQATAPTWIPPVMRPPPVISKPAPDLHWSQNPGIGNTSAYRPSYPMDGSFNPMTTGWKGLVTSPTGPSGPSVGILQQRLSPGQTDRLCVHCAPPARSQLAWVHQSRGERAPALAAAAAILLFL